MVDASAAAPIDRYVVNEYLSEGGMGAIYLGKKLGAGGFEKEVVLKQLLPEFTQQPEFIDLFLREARLSATLDHANIIHTIDLVTAGAEYFIVMEYLAGADLRTLLKKIKRMRGRMSAAGGIYVAREILSALAYAHAKIGPDGKPLRLIHRDVSPSNILVSHNGEVKLTDFGIAKAATHNSVFYRVKGKVGYMSPEQARSEPIDHRSDLYSLAVVLFEMITGERLFVHVGLTTTPEQIYSQPIPMLSRKIDGLPADLDKVMLRALAIDPDARYQSANELQEALLRVAHRHGLLMSAPELGAHLRKVAGAPTTWREADEAEGGAAPHPGGTEVYDMGEPEGTEQLDASEIPEIEDDDDDEDFGAIRLPPRPAGRARAKTSITQLSRLQGVELTGMINIADMPKEGDQPLVDLDQMGRTRAIADPSQVVPTLRATTSAPVVEAAPRPRRPPPAAEETTTDHLPVTEPRRWIGWVIAVIVVLAAAAAAIVIGMSGPRVTAPPPSPPPGENSEPPAGSVEAPGPAEPGNPPGDGGADAIK